MNAHFGDTFYFLALVSRDDAAHERAVAYFRGSRPPLITTAWVLTEVADALAAPAQRPTFLALRSALRADPEATIVPPSEQLFERGIDLYAKRMDKEWSLTDCISFVVMSEMSLTDALTADHHFEQAGFRALLK
jgi:predicted nucleic acid-binding protein